MIKTNFHKPFLLRLTAAITASATFGLIAAAGLSRWSFWAAVGLGFLFGTAFIAGTGYRIVFGVVRRTTAPAPASWSGATAGAALYGATLWAILMALRLDAALVPLAFGMAINVAYFFVKLACLNVGCCQAAPGHETAASIDLRWLEIAMTVGVLLASAVLVLLNVGLSGVMAIGGHLAIRALSRRFRNRSSWGWPPLRQPGSEIAPLLLMLGQSLVAVF